MAAGMVDTGRESFDALPLALTRLALDIL
jgi:hypothetical protein